MRRKTRDKVGNENEPVAVIDIGSSAVRLLIAELPKPGAWNTLESAHKPVALGRDVFLTGKISRNSTLQTLEILHGFQELMDSYGVKKVEAIATSAIREATNRDMFVDRVYLRTGIDIRVIDEIEANDLTYTAVQHALKAKGLGFERTDSLIIEVGTGSTELMILHRNRMAAAHTLRLGSVRLEQEARKALGTTDHLVKMLSQRVENTIEILKQESPLGKISRFVAVGGDARLAAKHAGRQKDDDYSIIAKADFEGFLKTLIPMSVDEIVSKYQIPYDEAEPLLPALLVYFHFMNATVSKELIVPYVSIREGLLIQASKRSADYKSDELYRQAIASARSLSRKYHVDEMHAQCVTSTALRLFDELQEDHGLGPQERLLLEIAGILHDIGIFVNFSAHHKHGQYLVAASDIFGLRKQEILTVSQIVRYHRKATPQPSHIQFVSLDRRDRIIVSKLAAILRVSDAMDRSHRQDVENFSIEKTDEELVIRTHNAGDISLEQVGIEEKADMFEDVFGLKVILI